MARLVRLKPLVQRRLRALGVRRTSRSSAAIGATIASLAEAGKLPGVLDTASMVPPTTTAGVGARRHERQRRPALASSLLKELRDRGEHLQAHVHRRVGLTGAKIGASVVTCSP